MFEKYRPVFCHSRLFERRRFSTSVLFDPLTEKGRTRERENEREIERKIERVKARKEEEMWLAFDEKKQLVCRMSCV